MTESVLANYLPEEEFAKHIGKSTRTIARWRRLGEGPPVTKIGRKAFYSRSAVANWLASCEIA